MLHFRRHLLFLVLTLLVPIARAAAPAPDLPQEPLNKLYADAKSQPGDKEQRVAKNVEIIANSRKCLADHPDVPPTAPLREILVRRVMLPAAERLFKDAPTPENRTQLIEIAGDVVKTPVYDAHLIVPEKVHAAVVLTRLNIFSGSNGNAVDAARNIRALVASFPPRPELKEPDAFTGQAIVYAAQLATETGEKDLADEYCKTIAERFLATENALEVLIKAGHPPVFEAEMTTLDGKKISIPADTKGKVVVLDFWATWCAPCVASMPHVKELYEKYKDQPVLILGVDCDVPMQKETPEENKTKVAAFVAGKGYAWTQTYSGEWPKAAVKYGVSHIPTVFVLGKDGKILSATARGREDLLIQHALTLPTPF